MIIKVLKPRKALNKAFLKVKPNRPEIERFKANLITLLDRTNDIEREEFHKNLVSEFLKKTYYDPNHFINTKERNDLVIHNHQHANSTVGVIIEAKKPTNKAEMMTTQKLNSKAFQELVLYYLRERITYKNLEVKNLVATNIYEWFIFDASLFDRLFAQNKQLVKQFIDFEGGRLADRKTDFFYKHIAEPFIDSINTEIEFTYFNFRDYQQPLRNASKADDTSLIALFKLLSPEHLLKLPFANDSNSLDKRFYSELLHIIGLTETKEGNKKLIERHKNEKRNPGSLLENAIIQLDSLDKISRLENPGRFGTNQQERLFNVGLELCITWINRILFLKLLEAQLITYHKQDKAYEFLNSGKIHNFDALNKLFFQVLAKQHAERTDLVQKVFNKVPYLNSSLFEPSEIEHQALFISNLEDDYTIPIYTATILKDEYGRKRTGNINTLQYLFEFLNAYDFASEGSEEIQENNKTLISASVLGLIFEKINGYKDGSFFTPGFITMYMCRESIRKAVVQKFNETKGWTCTDLNTLYDKIEDRTEANKIINGLKICDLAVGSGHFLVSALNEIIAIKNDLKILQDREGRRLKEYHFEVVNDELIVTDEEGALFEYNPISKESQRVQETLFHEKQTIIENCLFGVDINSNSVKICRLRLWIELLKNAYYIKSSSPDKGRWPQAGGVQKLNNLPHLKTFRKELRNNLTPAEAKLWTLLKGKQMEGRKFRRQHSVANYILDFYCPEERLAIELDGQGHFEASQAEYDHERDMFLEAYGIKVLRFENKWVWDNPEGLLEGVKMYFGKQPPRQPLADTPPYKGGELLELQTLPNIDINIKFGNSLVSRFAIDADLKQALKKSKWTIDSYQIAVDTYRNAESKEQKREMERLIADIKSNFRSEITRNDPKALKLRKLTGELFNLTNQQQLFQMSEKEKTNWENKVQQLTEEIKKLESEIEAIKASKIFENAFEWRFEFPEALNDEGDFVGFDVVIGNPPYIRQEEFSEWKSYLLSTFVETGTGTADLFVYFIEQALRILKPDGEFSFIVPNKWMRAGYGKKLRQFVSRHRIHYMIDFGDLPVFEEATTYPNIIQLKKCAPYDTFAACNVSTLNFPHGLRWYLSEHGIKVNIHELSPEGWSLSDTRIQALLSKIKSKGVPLNEYVNGQIYRGVLTGLNEAFVIDKETRERLIKEDPKSSEVIKPFLAGRDIKRYQTPVNDKYLILFPKGFTIKSNLPKDNPNYSVNEPPPRYGDMPYDKAWNWIRNTYPAIARHLAAFRDKAEARYDKGDFWWELRACDYYDEFEKPKVMLPDISLRSEALLDQNGEFYSVNTAYIIPGLSKSDLGILNSKLIMFFYSNLTQTIRGGYFRFIRQYLEQIPFVKTNVMDDLVSNILLVKKQNPTADSTELEHQIDQLVYKLYDLTEEEINIIENG